MVYSVLTYYFTRSPTAQIRAYSKKYRDASNVQRKGKKGQIMLKMSKNRQNI